MYRLIRNLVILSAVSVSFMASAGITPFSDDFESYVATDIDTFDPSGWKVFGRAYEGAPPVLLYSYGPFDAPNNPLAPAFSAVAIGEGGASQGAQQFKIFSDYHNADHKNSRLIESSVYQEQQIDPADVGQIRVFRFEAKAGDLAAPGTANAFIKTIDPANNNNQTNFVTQDTTATPATWTVYELSLSIDAALAGQLIRFGFSNTATDSNPSAVFYDNVDWFSSGADADGDGVSDLADNCTAAANPEQVDTDADGHGNLCDGDFNNDCSTNIFDFYAFKLNFGGSDPEFDLDNTGGAVTVNIFDNFIFKGLFGQPPGPSAAGSLCNP